MAQKLKLAILSIALTVGLTGLAQAQWDNDDYYRRGDGYQARQYGYQNGYRDGMKQGRHEGGENDPEDFHVPNDDRASRGYGDWMGPIWVYQNAYREGYRAGFRAGYNNESRTCGYGDGGAYDYPTVYSGGGYYGGGYGGFGDRAYQIGFRDGASVAREDAARGKPFNPNPRAAAMTMRITAIAATEISVRTGRSTRVDIAPVTNRCAGATDFFLQRRRIYAVALFATAFLLDVAALNKTFCRLENLNMHVGGGLIHLLLVVGLVVLAINLFSGRRSAI